MNTIILIGRLCNNNELRYTNSGTPILQNTLAIKREAKNKDGNYESDFVIFTLFGKTAEFLHKYTNKGDTICLTGKIRIDKYTNELGEVKYRQYVRGSSVEIIKHKKEETQAEKKLEEIRMDDVVILDEELPF